MCSSDLTVSKILKILTRASILASVRGAHGGYRLVRDPGSISAAEILRFLEGPIALMECMEDGAECQQEAVCPVRSHWLIINGAVEKTLEKLTLKDMTTPLVENRMQVAGIGDSSGPVATTDCSAAGLDDRTWTPPGGDRGDKPV